MNEPGRPIISLIAACAKDGVIGKKGELSWHIPEDLKYFKSITKGKPVIMGRVTFQSIGKALPGRHNIIVSKSGFDPGNGDIDTVPDIESALAKAGNAPEIMIIGGATIYRQTIGIADRLYITEIDMLVDGGDSFFPKFDEADFTEVKRQELPAITKGAVKQKAEKGEVKPRPGLVFRVLERRKKR